MGETPLRLLSHDTHRLCGAVPLAPSARCHAACAPAPHPIRCRVARSLSSAAPAAVDCGLAVPGPASSSPADLLPWPALLPPDASRSELAVLTSPAGHADTSSLRLPQTSSGHTGS